MVKPHCIAIGLIACLLAGCDQKDGAAPASPAANAAPAFKVELLETAPPNDGGWNQLAYDALKEIEAKTGATVQQNVVKPADQNFTTEVREAARANFKMLICHGGEYGSALLQAGADGKSMAEQFPGMVFINSGGEQAGPPNFQAVTFQLEQASYLAGIVAANVTKTKKIAAIGGKDFPTVVRVLKAFINGARSVDPSIVGKIAYADTWDDPLKAKGQAQALIQDGADVIFQNTDSASQGIFEACAAAKIPAFGCNGNQNDDRRFSSLLLGSTVMELGKIFVDAAEKVKAGTFKGGAPLSATLADGYIAYVPNPKCTFAVPSSAAAAIETAKQKIISGSLDVNAEPKN